MDLRIVDGPADTATVILEGKLDIAGAGKIETPMSVLGGSKKGLVIDLASVTFLASIGIRHMVTAAKAIRRKGGQVVLLNPIPAVAEVLETSGITEIMPIVRSDAEAKAALGLA